MAKIVSVAGEPVRLQQAVVILDANGDVVSSFGAGTGGATSAKQDTQITAEQAILASIGAKVDAAATTDAGTFSLIALIKRILGYLSGTVSSALIQTNNTESGASGNIASGKVTLAIFFSEDFVGTVAGQAFSGPDGADFFSFDPIQGRTYPAIPFTISAGSFDWIGFA